MTVSKAYSLLERDGVVELARGQGMRVAERNGVRDNLEERQDRLTPLVEQLLAIVREIHAAVIETFGGSGRVRDEHLL